MFDGGFAGMWKDVHKDNEVAVQVLSPYMTSDFDMIKKVGSP